MHRIPVTSTTLRSVGYNEKERTLELEFTSREVYEYEQVPPSVYNELMKADSHGKYFNEEIKGVYDYIQLNRNS